MWAYTTFVKVANGFTPFHLVSSEEVVFPIECEIPSLKLVVELILDTQPLEQRLVMLERAFEHYRVALQAIEVAKKHTKSQYDQKLNLHAFHEGYLILLYG